MITVHLGFGSNLGDRRQNIQLAVASMVRAGVVLKRVSSLYETKPVGYIDQPLFYNAVVRASTDLLPYQLLQLCLSIEKSLGRTRQTRWGPRTIDIDILLYGQEVISEQDLTVPHPRLAERAFVLVPLIQVSPGLVLPGGKKIQHYLAQLDCWGVQKVAENWLGEVAPT